MMRPMIRPLPDFAQSIWKHGFLVIIICLIGFNVVLLVHMIRTDYPYEKYASIVVSLVLLFNHIAFVYTTKGLAGKVMKIIAFAWLIVASIYIYTVWSQAHNRFF